MKFSTNKSSDPYMGKKTMLTTKRMMDLELLTMTAGEQDLRVMVDSSMKASDKCTGVVQNQIEV